MPTAFLSILDTSIVASLVILCVLLVRICLRKAPKRISYVLWSVVLFRLLCPFSVECTLSIIPARAQSIPQNAAMDEYEHVSPGQAALAAYHAVGDALNGGLDTISIQLDGPDMGIYDNGEHSYTHAFHHEVWLLFFGYLWPIGMAGMTGYSVVSLVRLRRKLIGAVPLRDNIYLADHIASPFVTGLFRPRIYLPSSLPAEEQAYIILHEQYHIRRMDHVIKLLAFLALTIHWFNPLVWAAFVLSGKDMEMSCDEAVIAHMEEDIRADYSASLLSLATGRRILAGTPLAFGEGDTKDRIHNVLNWKKPSLWVCLLAGVVCAAVLVVCGTDPKSPSSTLICEETAQEAGTVNGTFKLSRTQELQMVTLRIEEWRGGACEVQREQMEFLHARDTSIRVELESVFSHRWTNCYFEVSNRYEYSSIISSVIDFPDEPQPFGWMYSTYGDSPAGKEQVVAPGDEVVLAAIVYDTGSGIEASWNCYSFTKDPRSLEEPGYAVVIRAVFHGAEPEDFSDPAVSSQSSPDTSEAGQRLLAQFNADAASIGCTATDWVEVNDGAYGLLGVVQYDNADGSPWNVAFLSDAGTQPARMDFDENYVMAPGSKLTYLGRGYVRAYVMDLRNGHVTECVLGYSKRDGHSHFDASSQEHASALDTQVHRQACAEKAALFSSKKIAPSQ